MIQPIDFAERVLAGFLNWEVGEANPYDSLAAELGIEKEAVYRWATSYRRKGIPLPKPPFEITHRLNADKLNQRITSLKG